MENLISLDGAADVINNLINKISDVVGWIATHDTPQRLAESTFIQEIQASNLEPITKAVLISNAKKTIREYRNQKDVLNIALSALSPSANPLAVDDDWIAQFMDKVRLVTTQQFQILWGNILAGECNAPGSIPKSLLHIMEQMDSAMADNFVKLSAVSVWTEGNGKKTYSPIITGGSLDTYYKELGIQYNDLVELQSVGLIETSFGFCDVSYSETPQFSPVIIHYHDQTYTVPNGKQTYNVGNVIYTGAGQALRDTISVPKIEGFFEEKCIPLWEISEK